MPLAVAFIAVAAVICDEFCADCFHRPEPAEAEQERRGVSVLRLPVQPGQLEDKWRHVVCARGAPQKACQRARQVASGFLAAHQHRARKARHGESQIHARLLEFLDHFAGGLKLAP